MRSIDKRLAPLAAAALVAPWLAAQTPASYDLAVYGGTAAGAIAAVGAVVSPR